MQVHHLKALCAAAALALAGGAHAASTTITNGTLKAVIDDAGNFDSSSSTMLEWMGKEFIAWGAPGSWYWLDENGTSHIAAYGTNPFGGTTYGVGSTATTTVAFGGWSFVQTIAAVTPDKLTVILNVTNNTGAAAYSSKWGVGFDPDQDIPSVSPTFATINTVLGTGNASAVRATGPVSGYSVTLQNDTSAAAFAIAAYIDPSACCSPVNPATILSAGQGTGFSLTGDYSINLGYDLGTIANGQTVSIGYSYIFAVPEPQTYALMLAGLAAVGFVARRRRSD